MRNSVRVKICCISSIEEARLAIKYGASALGLVSQMPSGPGVISLDEIASIINYIPPPVAPFLLTSATTSEELIQQQKLTNAPVLQLCDKIEQSEYVRLREKLNGIKLVQVVHVTGPESLNEAKHAAFFADALLLDSGNTSLKVKELGGTGRVHDWDISRQICDAINKPVFLAGGLNIENISEALEKVHPFGIDLCTGLRVNGKLDEGRLADFMQKIYYFNSKKDKEEK